MTVTPLGKTTVIPLGRPRTDEDKNKKNDIVQAEVHAACLAAVVTRKGTPPKMKFARVGATKVTNTDFQRKAMAEQRNKEHDAAAKAWVEHKLDVLDGFLTDITKLPNLIIFPNDHNEATTDGAAVAPTSTPLSVAQTQRALDQVRALRDFYAVIRVEHPHKSVLECADTASENNGVARGITVYRWHLEV